MDGKTKFLSVTWVYKQFLRLHESHLKLFLEQSSTRYISVHTKSRSITVKSVSNMGTIKRWSATIKSFVALKPAMHLPTVTESGIAPIQQLEERSSSSGHILPVAQGHLRRLRVISRGLRGALAQRFPCKLGR